MTGNRRKRVAITLDGMMLSYVDDLIRVGLYGDTRAAVLRGFLRDGIIKAIPHVIKPKTAEDFR